ncbi:Chlorophyllase-2- chloroplastic [Striga hermonthica]|uniref:Chlorophyllase-2- chloroplastic n=1 Tax=Striga hermonthica TaxID=68872 RepID=A0A9N7QZ23_STRHE|nr:Chlorophyllase-2- chloroplastic [Striga hermonthica]
MNSDTVPTPDVFSIGNYSTSFIKVEPQTCAPNISKCPPKQLLISSPTEGGIYPVLLFLHGYLLYNSFYSQLLQHVASHGFIVIAPQLYCIAGADASEEIEATADITKWVYRELARFLPPQVRPNLDKLGLAGHSRGAKVAFALLLNISKSSLDLHLERDKDNISLKFSAVLGIDPVDGMEKGKQTPPPVLTYTPHSFDLGGMGALIVGSGLGHVKRNPLFPACAPDGMNHEDFYRECRRPAYYFVAKDYGHLDVLDDDTKGLRGKATCLLCKNGESRGPMRRFVGGAVVAFLKAYLEGDSRDLVLIREGRQELPLELQRLEFQV